MSPRRSVYMILFSLLVFPCFLLVHRIYMYYHPELDTNILDIVVSVLVYMAFTTGVIITGIVFYRNAKKLLRQERRAHLKDEQYKKLMEDSGVSTITVDKSGIVRFM